MISEKIRRLRLKNHMTQQQLAQALELSPSTVGMYEQGRREPDLTTMRKLCRVFGVSADDLLCTGCTDEPKEIDRIIDRMKTREGLLFKGAPLSEEDIEKIAEAMRLGAEIALRGSGSR